MRTRLSLALAVAALSGFIALSYEIVWYRVLSVMTGGSAATFGLLLAAYLFGLAAGSRASASFCRGEGGETRELRLVAVIIVVANVVAGLVVPILAWSAGFAGFGIGIVFVALGAAFLGSVLPLVSHFGIEPDDRAGARLSYVYLSNILGSAAGSLVTGFVLMDLLPLASIVRLLVVFGFALAAALLALSGLPRARALASHGAIAACALGAFLVVPALHDRVYERLVFKKEYDGTQRFSQVVETRSGVITVTEDGTVYGGGAYDGVLNVALQDNDKNGIVRAYIVGAIHPEPREVLMVGLSGGAWAQVVVHLPGVERLTIVEINPGYLEVVRRRAEVASLLDNPKATVLFDDGRRWLLRHPDRRFDVIVMNTTMHWRAHATSLLSTDFMNIAREHLRPGGVLYFNTTDSYDVQLTAAKTFPHFKRIANFVAVSDAPFDFDRARWRQVLETMRIEGKPVLDLAQEADLRLFDELRGYNDMEPAWSILERYEKTHTIVTDDNMAVEWRRPFRTAY